MKCTNCGEKVALLNEEYCSDCLEIKINEIVVPPLVSSKQVASMINIDPRNMSSKRKSKGFPKPIVTVDNFPLWLKSDVDDWLAAKTKKEAIQNGNDSAPA